MSLDPGDVTACLVTRGNIDMNPILDSLIFPNVIVWDNSRRPRDWFTYGRYKALGEAKTRVCFFQDDDVIVSPAQQRALLDLYKPGVYLTNQAANHNPPEFSELTLPGWGSLTDTILPDDVFERWIRAGHTLSHDLMYVGCDIVFSLLTPHRETVDLGQNHLPYAFADDRLHRTPEWQGLKPWFYQEALRVRNSTWEPATTA